MMQNVKFEVTFEDISMDIEPAELHITLREAIVKRFSSDPKRSIVGFPEQIVIKRITDGIEPTTLRPFKNERTKTAVYGRNEKTVQRHRKKSQRVSDR